MCKQAVPQLRFEPCTLRGHYVAAVGDIKQLLDADGIQAKSRLHFTAVHPAFQFLQSADPAHEIDPFVRPGILNGK